MKIRHKLVFLIVIYISGIIAIALLSLYGWQRTAEIQLFFIIMTGLILSFSIIFTLYLSGDITSELTLMIF